MVAYSFKRRFVFPIVTGRKPHTIRAPRKRRHALPGEDLQLYSEQRTPRCEMIGQVPCSAVHAIQLLLLDKDAGANVATSPPYEPPPRTGDALDDFAYADGFDDWEDLLAFWAVRSPGATEFDGYLIAWEPPTLQLTEWGKRAAAMPQCEFLRGIGP